METVEIPVWLVSGNPEEATPFATLRFLGLPAIGSVIRHEGQRYSVVGQAYGKMPDAFDRSRNDVYFPVLYVKAMDSGIPE